MNRYAGNPGTVEALVRPTEVHRVVYVETRLDDQFLLAATARHELVLEDGHLKIKLKRVDLLNSDAAFGNIQLFL